MAIRCGREVNSKPASLSWATRARCVLALSARPSTELALSAFAMRLASSSALATAWNRAGFLSLVCLVARSVLWVRGPPKSLRLSVRTCAPRSFRPRSAKNCTPVWAVTVALPSPADSAVTASCGQRRGQVIEAMRLVPQLLGRHVQHHSIEAGAPWARQCGPARVDSASDLTLGLMVKNVMAATLLTAPIALTSLALRSQTVSKEVSAAVP